jgi:hypothetical protein
LGWQNNSRRLGRLPIQLANRQPAILQLGIGGISPRTGDIPALLPGSPLNLMFYQGLLN